MMKLTSFLLALVALLQVTLGYRMGYGMDRMGRYRTGDLVHTPSYRAGGLDYYRPSDMDWGNFSPNPAYRTRYNPYGYNNGYNNGYYNNYGYDYGYNGYYNNGYYGPYASNYYRYRPGYYDRGYYGGGASAYYANMDWGAFSPGYGRGGRYYRPYMDYNRYYW